MNRSPALLLATLVLSTVAGIAAPYGVVQHQAAKRAEFALVTERQTRRNTEEALAAMTTTRDAAQADASRAQADASKVKGDLFQAQAAAEQRTAACRPALAKIKTDTIAMIDVFTSLAANPFVSCQNAYDRGYGAGTTWDRTYNSAMAVCNS
jgi:hypothetical protein